MQAKNKTPKPILSQVGKFEQDGKKYVSVPVGTYVSKSAYSIKIAEIKKDYANKLFMFELKKNYSDYLADRYKDISEQTFKRLMYMTNKKIWAYEQITLNEQKLSTQADTLNRLSKDMNDLSVSKNELQGDYDTLFKIFMESEEERIKLKSELQASTDKCAELENDLHQSVCDLRALKEAALKETDYYRAERESYYNSVKKYKHLYQMYIIGLWVVGLICLIAYLIK